MRGPGGFAGAPIWESVSGTAISGNPFPEITSEVLPVLLHPGVLLVMPSQVLPLPLLGREFLASSQSGYLLLGSEFLASLQSDYLQSL